MREFSHKRSKFYLFFSSIFFVRTGAVEGGLISGDEQTNLQDRDTEQQVDFGILMLLKSVSK